MPDDLFPDNGMFVFKYNNNMQNNKSPINFIFCKPHDEIIGRTLLGMLSYCKRNKKFKFYLMFNYIFSFAIGANEKTQEEYDAVPLRLHSSNLLLQDKLNDSFVTQDWDYMCQLTFCFKLTHKRQLSEESGTYYHFIRGLVEEF